MILIFLPLKIINHFFLVICIIKICDLHLGFASLAEVILNGCWLFFSKVFLTYLLLSKNQWRNEGEFSISCRSKCLVSGFHVSSLCIMTNLWKKCQHESMKYQFIISKSCMKYSRTHFFLRLYMLLTTWIEPAAFTICIL